MSAGPAKSDAPAMVVDVKPPSAQKTPAPATGSGMEFRGRAALAALGLAAAVAISAGVAAVVASAIVAGAREERVATSSFAAAPQGARRLEEPTPATPPTAAEGGAAATTAATDGLCLDAMEGEMCHRLVLWAMQDGARFYPERYKGFNHSSPFHEVQAAVHVQHPDLCSAPCTTAPPKDAPAVEEGPSAEGHGAPIQCDYGHDDPAPGPAGCFISQGGKMLAEKLTYDGRKYDIPGGHSNWREPARCTAYRETYEETGYLAAPRELLGVVRGGYKVYRCELLRQHPVKGHDHEISWVGWLDAGEIKERLDNGRWRYQHVQANRYLGWLR